MVSLANTNSNQTKCRFIYLQQPKYILYLFEVQIRSIYFALSDRWSPITPPGGPPSHLQLRPTIHFAVLCLLELSLSLTTSFHLILGPFLPPLSFALITYTVFVFLSTSSLYIPLQSLPSILNVLTPFSLSFYYLFFHSILTFSS